MYIISIVLACSTCAAHSWKLQDEQKFNYPVVKSQQAFYSLLLNARPTDPLQKLASILLVDSPMVGRTRFSAMVRSPTVSSPVAQHMRKLGQWSRRELAPKMTASSLVDHFSESAAGGEWAGWQCDFATTDGSLRKVPDMYCSDTMIEWDQIPSGFELLSTESFTDGVLSRRFLRVLPADGCFSDDLTVQVSRSTINLVGDSPKLEGDPSVGAYTLDDAPIGANPWHLRTMFTTSSPLVGIARSTNPVEGPHRVRLTMRYQPSEQRIVGVIRIAVERKWGDTGALQLQQGGGNRPDGQASGLGLDASTVAGIVAARCFADLKPRTTGPKTNIEIATVSDEIQKPGTCRQSFTLPAGISVAVHKHDEGNFDIEVRLRGESYGEEGSARLVLRKFDKFGKLVESSMSAE